MFVVCVGMPVLGRGVAVVRDLDQARGTGHPDADFEALPPVAVLDGVTGKLAADQQNLFERGLGVPPASSRKPESHSGTVAESGVTGGDGTFEDLLALVDGPVTPSTLAALRSSVTDYWRRDDQHGGAPLRPAVVGHFRYVNQLAHSANGALHRQLLSLAAELARLAGWAYFDARHYSTARSYFTEALKLSHSQNDRLFLANVLSCLSLQATYDGHATDAVALACRAQDAVRAEGSQPLVMAMLYMREAFAHAVLHDAASCYRVIDRSRDWYDRARGHEDEAPTWVQYFDEAKLLTDQGIALARLGEAARAEPLIAEGLRRERAGQQRGRAFHAFWLASSQLDQGKLDRACGSAGVALDLSVAIDSPRVSTHVQEFHRRLAPYASEPSVVAFEQRMRQTLG